MFCNIKITNVFFARVFKGRGALLPFYRYNVLKTNRQQSVYPPLKLTDKNSIYMGEVHST